METNSSYSSLLFPINDSLILNVSLVVIKTVVLQSGYLLEHIFHDVMIILLFNITGPTLVQLPPY